MIAWFARHPTASNLLMFVFVLLGVLALRDLNRETFPDIQAQKIRVTAVYPGASPEDVDASVVERIENRIDAVRNVKEVISESREGMASVTIEMLEGRDFTAFRSDISSAIDGIGDFPDAVEDPVVEEVGVTDRVMSIFVTGSPGRQAADATPQQLKQWCNQIKRRLKLVRGVATVNIAGFSDRQLRIELDTGKLREFGLSTQDVVRAVESQNVNAPVGELKSSDGEILLRVDEQRVDELALQNLVIREGEVGAAVLLRDVGTVADVFESDAEQTFLNGVRAGVLQIDKTRDQDLIKVADAVNEFLSEEEDRNPRVTLTVSGDSSDLVQQRLSLLIKNGWQGVLLVFLTLWLFFNYRLSFWVAMSVPVSFLGGIFFLPMLGLTVNMMTMVGMLLALGILMDDGIVIAENIASHRAMGKSPMQAAIDGVTQVSMGVGSSFVTTVCVLGPLIFIDGDIGKVLAVIPIMLILVISVSLVEAFCILPAHLSHSFREERPSAFRKKFDELVDWVRNTGFGRLVDAAVRWRYATIGSVIGLFLVSLAVVVSGWLRFQAFPNVEGDVVVARVAMPSGTSLSRTEAAVRQITDALSTFEGREVDGRELVQSWNVEYGVNTEVAESGPHVATVTVDLLSTEVRETEMYEIVRDWRGAIGELVGVSSLAISEPAFGPAGRPIEIRVHGEDPVALESASISFRDAVRGVSGTRDVSTDLRKGKRQYLIRLYDGARRNGLTAADVAQQLRAAFQGVAADDIQVGVESYELDVRLNSEQRRNISDLETFPVTLPDRRIAPLSSLAELLPYRGWSKIVRVDGQRTVTIRGDVDASVITGQKVETALRRKPVGPDGLEGKSIIETLEEENPGVRFAFAGESAESSETFESIAEAGAIGLFGVFVLLSLQFRSYWEPLVVMSAIPLSLIGVFWGHLLVQIDLSMPSLLGVVSLTGVVVNDSILLVLFLKERIAAGDDPIEAAGQASRQRFRAIILTSLTTIAGLLPLIAEPSVQAQTLAPLAVSIAFGIAASTVLVLVVIPCLYAVMADFGAFRVPETSDDE